MDLTRFWHKLCMKEAYGIAIRPLGDSTAPFVAKYPTAFNWYADPFVAGDSGAEYVFVEQMNHYRVYGDIAVAPIENGQVGDFKTVIREPFHMSFPHVFQWDGLWYMLPETFMSGEVRLYRSDDFPYKWSLDTVLLTNARLVDHILFPAEGGFRMVSYDITVKERQYNRVFRLDMERKKAWEIFPQGDWCRERPGGNFYQQDGRWFHVIQDCVKTYGDFLHLFEVEEFSDKVFSEREVKTIRMEDIPLAAADNRLEHIHTYNRDNRYETIDFRYWKFYPDKFFLHHWQHFYRHN